MKTKLSLLFLAAVVLLLAVYPGTAAEKSPTEIKGVTNVCLDCHNSHHVFPGISNQFLKSKHAQKNVTCIQCHGAKENEPDAFWHNKQWISIIVTPKDCEKCHQGIVKEFNLSAHHNARDLTTRGCGRVFAENLANTQYPLKPGSQTDKTAASTTACWNCHGSKIKMNPQKKGMPTHETWPNGGIARENPDGSVGNCAACHENHEFSLVQARQPESCAVCHNAGGGDPQVEAYKQSRHGMTYYAQKDQMNLDAPYSSWVAGKDYCAAPTCATCHLGAAGKQPVTHNINERLDWQSLLEGTNTVAFEDKCGPMFHPGYEQPKPDIAHWYNMRAVCLSCHSGKFTDNYKKQYQDVVSLFKKKWLEPGKELYNQSVEVLMLIEKGDYPLFTHTIDFAWWTICNSNTKYMHTGAAMMSPGSVEVGIGDVAANWTTSFIPSVEAVIEKADKVENKSKALQEALKRLKTMYQRITTDPVYCGPWRDNLIE